MIPENHAPRVMKVIEGRDVAERNLIEGAYDVDLRGVEVIAIEFKLPIDEVTYKDSAKELEGNHALGPGRGVLAWLPDQRQ